MYHKFTTPALVLMTQKRQESAVAVTFLTRDFGLLTATAPGVRYLKSKLRPSLTQFAYCSVTLVRGRGGWRVVSAELKAHFYNDLRGRPKARRLVARVSLLARKLMDESPDCRAVFDTILEGFEMSAQTPAAKLSAVERLIILRLLYLLGYLENRPPWRAFLEADRWTAELLDQMRTDSLLRQATKDINYSLTASGLW